MDRPTTTPLSLRSTLRHASRVAVGTTAALAVIGIVAPSAAYADAHFTPTIPFHHSPSEHPGKPGPQSHVTKPGKPGKPKPGDQADDQADDQAGDQADDDANDATGSGAATNGGKALPGDEGVSLDRLKPTPPPLTAYEMPFPCGEVWTGSTRPGHSPSIRSVDFNYPGGDLGRPVVAAASGTVVTAVTGRNRPSYGQYVVIDHGNGETSLYGHLDSVLVTVGQAVQAGTQLGTVGETGNASGPHLHFEERVSGAVVDAWFHGAPFPMNGAEASQNCGDAPVVVPDIPLAGDMFGTKPAEVMVYRRAAPAAFHIDRGTRARTIKLGDGTAQPVLGDWDGNGRVDPGVREPNSRVFTMQVKRKKTTIKFGKTGDLPVAGNWDGIGGWEVGVRRPGSAKFLLRMADGTVRKVSLGDANDLPVTGDWDGDGVTDLGVFDQATATFTLLETDAQGAPYTSSVQFGSPGDLPVTGDWDGDGVTDLGTWTPTTAVFTKRRAVVPIARTRGVRKTSFGRPVAK